MSAGKYVRILKLFVEELKDDPNRPTKVFSFNIICGEIPFS